jgi:hypothetical protein
MTPQTATATTAALERGVELSVAAAVQTVAIGCLPGAAGNRCGSAEASKGGGVAEASNVSGLRDDRGSEIAAGAVEVAERVLVLDQQLGDLAVKIRDPRIEVLDVPGELADATRRGASGKACAELQPSELSQLALAIAADDAGLCDGIVLGPVRTQPLDRLGAVAHEASTLQLEHPERPHQLGLLRWTEILSLRAHHVSDRERVPRIGLSRPATVALAVGAPRRNLQHLKARAGKSSDQAASVASRALNPDHCVCGLVLDEPVDQAAVALRGIRDDERGDLATTVIDQRSGVVVLVNVDSDDQGGLLSGG